MLLRIINLGGIRMKKKLLAIVLTSILGVGLVLTGCGPKEEGTDKKR